jgi:gamma-glutamylcyclotransferase (GGCT)/AIG2-like uncharacterized protein YtfP
MGATRVARILWYSLEPQLEALTGSPSHHVDQFFLARKASNAHARNIGAACQMACRPCQALCVSSDPALDSRGDPPHGGSYAQPSQSCGLRNAAMDSVEDLSFGEVADLIATVNETRRLDDKSREARSDATDAEARLEEICGISRTLAVYGTLVPGRANHHIVEPLGGEWTEGFVEGDLSPTGWGATLGYPAFRPRANGPLVAVHVLTSPLLSTDWARLDEFEGPGYRRILVPVFRISEADVRQLYSVANLYAAADDTPDESAR